MSHTFVLVLLLYGKGVQESSDTIKAEVTSPSLTAGISFCLSRGLETPCQGSGTPTSSVLTLLLSCVPTAKLCCS